MSIDKHEQSKLLWILWWLIWFKFN